MRRVTEVLRLAGQGLSYRQIGQSVGISASTVQGYLSRAQRAGVSWPVPDELDAAALEGGEEFRTGTLEGARSLQVNDVQKSKDDGRLPSLDHNTRIVVFGNNALQSRALAEEISTNAFHNVTFFAGSWGDLIALVGTPL
jgi:Homeodomain-like domain/Rhodanese-like domain